MNCRDEMNYQVARYFCHQHWIFFFYHFILMYISIYYLLCGSCLTKAQIDGWISLAFQLYC